MKFPPIARLVLGFSLFLLVFGRVRIAPPDLAFYYSYTLSLVEDADYCFTDEYAHFPFAMHETYRSRLGVPANDWPMGTGIGWIPFLLFTRGLACLAAWSGHPLATDTAWWMDEWGITYGSTLCFGCGTLWLSYRLCRLEGVQKKYAAGATALMAAGSTLTYHLYVNSADSHLPSAFFIALFLYGWRTRPQPLFPRHGFLLGAILGMAALIRPHNAVFVLLPILDWIFFSRRIERISWRYSLAFLLGGALFFFPQLTAWKALYGSWFAVPRMEDVLWLHPHLFEMLFSDFHGMISWSPLFGLGLLGLILRPRHRVWLIPVAIQLYVYACNLAWWSGGSFGNRRMVGCVPLLILGLAVLLEEVKKAWLWGVAGLGAVWTALMLIAEVGGAVQLDHYQPWRELLAAIPAGFVPGIIRHFTRPSWSHALARIAVAAACSTLLAGGLWIFYRRRERWMRWIPHGVGCAGVFLGALCLAAALRTPTHGESAESVSLPGYDRFTWVVYYEGGFYHLKKERDAEAIDELLAATILEGRHPQPWMYLAYMFRDAGSSLLAYQYAREALMTGMRQPYFYQFFDAIISERIVLGTPPLHILYNERGILRASMGQYDLAELDFQQSQAAQPSYSLAAYNLENLESWKAGMQKQWQWE